MSKVVKKKKTYPKWRNRMIRDLPAKIAPYLHPSLRSLVIERRKRWNGGSPSQRLYTNTKKKYCRQMKPRVFPFYCEACQLNTRKFDIVRNHHCVVKRKPNGQYAKKPYDFAEDIKVASQGWKTRVKDGLAVLEKTPRPQHVTLQQYGKAKEPAKQPICRVPKLEDLCYKAMEFDVEMECIPIDAALVPTSYSSMCSSSSDSVVKKENPKHSNPLQLSNGHYCFKCRALFENFSDYNAHLEEGTKGTCKEKVPEYQIVETSDKLGTIPSEFAYRKRRHRAVKRDVSHVRCTSCQAGNFNSSGDLYSHMIKCALAKV